MTDRSSESLERVSALVDGQLHGEEFVQALTDLESSAVARSNWDTFHVLGDVMRSGDVNAQPYDADFVQRLRQRLSVDAIKKETIPVVFVSRIAQKRIKIHSANDSLWLRVAGVASVALVGVLAWQGLQWTSEGNRAAWPQLAQHNGTPPVQPASSAVVAQESSLTTVSQVMIRDPQLDAILEAHRQFGGISALQMPAGFVRNVTFEEGTR